MSEVTLKDGGTPKAPKTKKKHYWWRYLLVFFAGFITCIGVIAGGVAITGTVIKTKDLMTMLGLNPEEYLGIEYQNDTILSMVTKLMGKKFETLGDLNQVSPIIQKTVEETINPVLDENLHYTFNWDELSIKPFKADPNSSRPASEYDKNESIGEYIPRAIKGGVTLASFIDTGGELNNIIKYFLYPTDSEGNFDTSNPYSLQFLMDGGSDFYNDIVNKVKIGDIIDTSGNPFLAQVATWGVNDFTDENIRNLKIGPLFSQSAIDSNPLLKAISDHNWSIDDLSNMDNINALKIGEIVDTSGMSSGILYAIRNRTVAELQEDGFIDTLYLSDIFPNVTDGVMAALIDQNFTVGDLSNDTKVKSLTLDQILGGITSDSILYDFKDTPLSDVNDIDVSTVKLTSVLDLETQIKTNNILNAIWESNHDITIGELSDQSVIDDLKLSDVFPSAEGVLKVLADKDVTIGQLSDEDTTMTLTLDEVIGPLTDDNVLYNFRNTQLKDVDSIDVSTVKITSVISETDINNNNILKALVDDNPDITVGDLKNESTITGLLIKDVFPSATGVMGTLADKNYTINDLTDGDVITSLTLEEALGTISSDSVLYNFKDTPLNEIQDIDVKTVKLTSVLTMDEINNNKILKAIYDENHDVTIGDISNPDTIYNLTLGTVIDCTGDTLLQSLSDTKLNELSTKIGTLTLKDVIDIGDDPTAVIYKIANALDGVPISEIGSHFDTLEVGDIIEIGTNPPKVLETLEHVQLNELAATLETLKICEVIDIDMSDGSTDPLKAIGNVNINDSAGLMDALKSGLKLKDVTDIDPATSPKILVSLQDCTLSEIPTVLGTLSLGEVIDIDDGAPQILQSLKDVPVFGGGVNNLTYKLEHLKFNDYFTEDDCQDGFLKSLWNTTTPGGDFELSEIEDHINQVKLVDVLCDKIYERDSSDQFIIVDGKKKISGTWWCLLTETSETFTAAEKRFVLKNGLTYTIDDMGKLVTNMNNHLTVDKIRDLVDAGFITISDESKLDEPISVHTMYGDYQLGTKLLGDYTLNEVFALFM